MKNDSDLIFQTVKIVSSYVASNAVPMHQLPSFITSVHTALNRVATGSPTIVLIGIVGKAASVKIRESITTDALISFIDGKPYKILKRHLSSYGLDASSYRARFGLPDDYPMVSPNYAARRSEIAKSIGLGRADIMP